MTTYGNMNFSLSAPITFVAELREFAKARDTKVSYVLREAFEVYKRAKACEIEAETV
jgi:hypothetical protein